MTRNRQAQLSRILVTAATASYAANVTFGVAVATGLVDNRRIRWVHHALFVATASTTAVAIAVSARAHPRTSLALLPAIPPLVSLPYVRRGVRGHATMAGLAAPAFASAVILAWRRR